MSDLDPRKQVGERLLSEFRTGEYPTITSTAHALCDELPDDFPTFDSARSYMRRLDAKHAPDQKEVGSKTSYEESPTKGTAKFDFKGSLDKPMTVDEFVAKHGVDLDVWQIAKIKIRSWGVTSKLREFAGDKIVGEHLQAGKNYYIAVDLERKKDSDKDPAEVLAEQSDRILDSVRAATEGYERVSVAAPFARGISHVDSAKERDSRMVEPCIFDLHMGKLCWGEETKWEDWDSKIAASAALESLKKMLDFWPNYGKIWLPLGHDFFNSDGPGDNGSGGRTTRGTAQDEDTRWAKSFNTGVDVALSMINLCLEYAPVDITIMRGNHDEVRCVYMGRLLKEVFKDHPHVTVDDSLGMLKSYTFGDNFLATCHGQLEAMQKVVTECALRFPKFGKAKWREIHTGHGHRKQSAGMMLDGWEEQSVRWRMIPSLTSPDNYHARNLYHNLSSAESFYWDKKDLYLGHQSANR